MRTPSKLLWRALLNWYRKNGRTLPWRGDVSEYAVAVSEFMLQQTQVSRVVPLFTRFMERFPTWEALAAASQDDVVRAWKGLGYNLRAVRLRALAQDIAESHDGRLPKDPEALLAMKGVGPYTARALSSFAHRRDVLAPDTNIRRVLSRLLKGALADPKTFSEDELIRAERSMPAGKGYDANSALMDLGATVCVAAKPRCEACPLSAVCASYPAIQTLTRLPRQKTPRKETVDRFGLPNRIYRGRVVDRLRERPIRVAELKGGERKALAGLERDGLVRVTAGTIRLL